MAGTSSTRVEHDPRQPRARDRRGAAALLADKPFGVVSLHRFELLNSRRLLTETLEVLEQAARHTSLVFIDHPVTVAAIERCRLQRFFDPARVSCACPGCGSSISCEPSARAPSSSPTAVAARVECFYLICHARSTACAPERREGLGENAVLSGMRAGVLRSFPAAPEMYRRQSALSQSVAVRRHRGRPGASVARAARRRSRQTELASASGRSTLNRSSARS